MVLQHEAVNKDFKSWSRNAIWVSKCNEYQNYWVLINSYRISLEFTLDLSEIDLLDQNFSDVDFDLL